MKKLFFVFAFMALAAVQANAQTVVLDADTSSGDNVATIVGETYTVTPVSGAWNDDNNVSGCDGGGANCTEGFEFSYTVDPSPSDFGGDTALVTDKFSTEAAAFAAAQGITFTALDTIAEVFLPCGGCSGAVGIITLEFVLQQIFGAITPGFSFSADDLAQLSVDFSPCGDGGCDLTSLDDFSLDEFDLAACDAGACDALFETAESILETAFECTGPSCMEFDLARYASELVESGMSEAEAQQFSTEFAQAIEQYLQDQIERELNVGREMDVEVPPDAYAAWEEGQFGPIDLQTGPTDDQYVAMEAYRLGVDVEVPPDAYAAWEEGQFGPIDLQTGPTDDQYVAMETYRLGVDVEVGGEVGGQAEDPSVSELSEAEAQQISAEIAQAEEQYEQGQIQRDINEALGIQDQTDMNTYIESVMPELAGFVVLAQSGPIKTYAAAGVAENIVTASLDPGR